MFISHASDSGFGSFIKQCAWPTSYFMISFISTLWMHLTCFFHLLLSVHFFVYIQCHFLSYTHMKYTLWHFREFFVPLNIQWMSSRCRCSYAFDTVSWSSLLLFCKHFHVHVIKFHFMNAYSGVKSYFSVQFYVWIFRNYSLPNFGNCLIHLTC